MFIYSDIFPKIMYFEEIQNKINLGLEQAKLYAELGNITPMNSCIDYAQAHSTLLKTDISKKVKEINTTGHYNATTNNLYEAEIASELNQTTWYENVKEKLI